MKSQASSDRALILREYAEAARANCSPQAWAYFSGGAADEFTLQANEQAWAELALRPRVLCDMTQGHTQVQILGRDWPAPLLVAPMGHLAWAHPSGESAVALAAVVQGCGFTLSQLTSTAMSSVAGAVTAESQRGGLWMQLYWQGHGDSLRLAAQAAAAGYEALVLTVDAPVQGVRDRELRARAVLPEGLRTLYPQRQSIAQRHAQGLCQGLADQAPTWAEVALFMRESPLPVILKGISHAQDAQRAIDVGAAALWVSNHGGRTLDTMPPSVCLLQEVAACVKRQVPLIVDGGIRRGTDVFKALALGAQVVGVGRLVAYGFAAHGARGVAHVLRLLQDELQAAMVLCGCARVADIGPQHVAELALSTRQIEGGPT